MKVLRTLVIVIAVTAVIAAIASAILLKRGATAQASRQVQPPALAENRGVLGQYEQLILSLSKRGDTNTATEVAKLVTAMQTGRATIEIATTVRILENLHSGRTNEAMQLLESRLDGAVMSFYGPSGNQHDESYDAVLKMAKEYRRKYPLKEGATGTNSAVERVFESLPQ